MARLLKRGFLDNVASEKGRFRAFLLACLKHYCQDERAKANAARRGGGHAAESLQAVGEGDRPLYDPASTEPSPDLEYERAWARTLLAHALGQLAQECARQGHSALYVALEPVLLDRHGGQSYREIGDRLGMKEGAVKMAAHRIRARLKRVIRDEVLQTVTNEHVGRFTTATAWTTEDSSRKAWGASTWGPSRIARSLPAMRATSTPRQFLVQQ